jgi:hypothetical protein
MNALRRMRGERAGARVRIACTVALIGLLAAVLVVPICDESYWRDEYRFAADADVNRLIEAITALDVPEARRLLATRTVDLNALSAWGMPPLAHAIVAYEQPGGEPLALLLIERGADVNRADERGDTPLMWSLGPRDTRATALLLRAGADVRARRPDGSTALHVSVHNGVPAEVVRMVLAAGADPTARDIEGKTAGDYARESGLADLAQLLDAPAPARPSALGDSLTAGVNQVP